ncbi:MAG: HlyD family efflux transporter periplasmic adaptor subunit [Planctomycetales bacterium]
MDSGKTVESEALRQAQRKLLGQLHALSQLAKSSQSEDEFFPPFLHGSAESLEAAGAGLWTLDDSGLQLKHQMEREPGGMGSEEDPRQREAQLRQAVASEEPILISPHNGGVAAGQCTRLLGRLVEEDAVTGVLELVFHRDVSSFGVQAHLRFLTRMCEIAAEFLRRNQTRGLLEQRELWSRIERFSRATHGSLDPKVVCHQLANEAARLIGCDRVSAAVRRGNVYRLEAVSGAETFERRANSVRLMQSLLQVALAAGEPLWYEGDDRDLPPQIAGALHEYLDESQAKSIGILPLREPAPLDVDEEEDSNRPPDASDKQPIIGAMALDFFNREQLDDAVKQRAALAADHGSGALANAITVDGVFLMSLWRFLGRMKRYFQGRLLRKTLGVTALVLAALVAMFVVPADFDLHAPGSLEPVVRREVFAHIEGVVDRIHVPQDKVVAKDATLIELRNDELELEWTDVVGQIQETLKRLDSVLNSRGGELTRSERNQLSGEERSLKESLNGLKAQEKLLARRMRDLQVKSPLGGQVVTWDVDELLIGRPVQRGQVLLTVADASQEWVVEMRLPEKRMGHVAAARERAAEKGEDLQVEFVPATDPGMACSGTVQEIALQADLDPTAGSIILITVKFDKSQLSPAMLRPGAGVTAKIHCGRRSIGYVWLHDHVDWVRREILFRL